MIIQLIYWKSVCGRLGGRGIAAARQQAPSREEHQAFARALLRHRGESFIRYR